ncbi:MAG: DUF2238 domain-containing protein [Nanoarchaeota archaeon]
MLDFYLLSLLCVFFLFWFWSGVKPLHRDAWFLENILVVVLLPLLFLSVKFFPLSLVSYSLITLFLILHVVGSHYTYAKTPIGRIVGGLFGTKRNMYDRLVHFSYGLLLTYPIMELMVNFGLVNGFWAYYFPLEFIVATSGLFEIIEWFVAKTADNKAGISFLGAQGDVWDAQKDMAVAALGSIITTMIVYFL